MTLNLEQLEVLKKSIEKDLKELEKTIPLTKKKKIGFSMSIVNYPTKCGKKTIYCSDTWEFEELHTKHK